MSYKVKSTYRPPGPALSRLIEVREQRLARCRAGDHEVQEVPANRVVYGPYGRRRYTGDRYCISCQVDLPAEEESGT